VRCSFLSRTIPTERVSVRCWPPWEFPDLSIGKRHSSRLSLHREGADLGVPIWINGRPATYTFDTGANMSLLRRIRGWDLTSRMWNRAWRS
jgi:hypothetical protein